MQITIPRKPVRGVGTEDPPQEPNARDCDDPHDAWDPDLVEQLWRMMKVDREIE
jgi:hypothetical protein